MKKLNLLAFITVAALAALSPKAAQAEDQELKIGVVAAESGSFVSAGNTIVAAAKPNASATGAHQAGSRSAEK